MRDATYQLPLEAIKQATGIVFPTGACVLLMASSGREVPQVEEFKRHIQKINEVYVCQKLTSIQSDFRLRGDAATQASVQLVLTIPTLQRGHPPIRRLICVGTRPEHGTRYPLLRMQTVLPERFSKLMSNGDWIGRPVQQNGRQIALDELARKMKACAMEARS